MLKYSLAATALLATIGLSACLDDPAGPSCTPAAVSVTGTAGDTTITYSGLRYIQTEAGTNQLEARWCFGAQVSYIGTLASDGSEFDRGTIPFTPGISSIIPGFAQGVVGMKVDENRRLIIPPNLAWGTTGNGAVPPNATVIFDVELIAVQ